MSIHRHLHVGVAQQLLDGANVVAIFEQVCGKGVAERVTARRFAIPVRRSACFTAFWIR